jgi:AraC family transcriptional regulator
MSELDTGETGAQCPIVKIAPSDVARRQIAKWNGVRVDAMELIRQEPFEYGFTAPCHLLIMSEYGERDDGETLIEGLPRSTRQEFSHQLSLVPGGHRFHGWSKPRVLVRVNFFYIDPCGPMLDPALRFAETEFKPRLHFFDRDLWETAFKLKLQAQHPDPAQRQYAEALGIVLAHELLRVNNSAVEVKQYVRGGLAAWQKKEIALYIEEHLAEDISLAALAELARLSPYHFARAFKQSFGLPPHRYMTNRRVEKAKGQLARSAASVTQIGLGLGFSEVSSFTTAFRKHVGITPTDYRRSLD